MIPAWVDVVSQKGNVQHAKFLLSSVVAARPGVVLDEKLMLNETVDDIEVRVFVGAEDDIRLESYGLVPVKYD